MIGYIEGISDAHEIQYCPFCGGEVGSWYGDGTAQCEDCGRRYGVVEVEEEERT